MQSGWWNKPVSIRPGITTHVTNTKQAARMLIKEEWGWMTKHVMPLQLLAWMR
jgi:hypothetical protein